MISEKPLVVLDACVLATFSVCGTLLRLAEPPELFEPRWSEEIIGETVRTQQNKLHWPESLTVHFESELRAHFAEAWIEGYEALTPLMNNDTKDRHVVAAAACCGASLILTFNLRHFQSMHLKQWNIMALHPQTFLIGLFKQDPAAVRAKLEQQAADRGRSINSLLHTLRGNLPEFVDLITREFA